VALEKSLVPCTFNIDPKVRLDASVEIHQMRVDVVQERVRWPNPKRHCKAASKRLDEPAVSMGCPEGCDQTHLPPLPTEPPDKRRKTIDWWIQAKG
jgi:hypothetical protein